MECIVIFQLQYFSLQFFIATFQYKTNSASLTEDAASKFDTALKCRKIQQLA